MQESLTYSNQYGEVTITVPDECGHITEMINNLVRPMLRGAGFAEKTIQEYLGDY